MSYLAKKLVGYQVIGWNIRLFACIADVLLWFQQGSSDAWKKCRSLYNEKEQERVFLHRCYMHLPVLERNLFCFKCFLWKAFNFCCVLLLKSPCPNLESQKKITIPGPSDLIKLVSTLFAFFSLTILQQSWFFHDILPIFLPLGTAYILEIAQCFDE